MQLTSDESLTLSAKTTLDTIERAQEAATEILKALRQQVNSNPPVKSPTFTIAKAAELINRSASAIRLAEADGRLPSKERTEGGHRRGYTLEDLDKMREVFGTRPWREAGDPPAIIAVQNFKGGVGKSTLTVHIAEYLAIHGYRVLVVDADAQASTTMHFGHVPDLDISEEETIFAALRLIAPVPIQRLVRKTHYHNLHLIAANLDLYNAEYEIAAIIRQFKKSGLTRLRDALRPLAQDYDVVLLDPPPALGMVSLSVLYAANALMIPVPPSMNDYASTAAFLKILHETMSSLAESDHGSSLAPEYNFIHMVIAKSDARNATHKSNIDMINGSFGKMVLDSEIASSAEFEHASSEMRSVFDPRESALNHSVRNRCLAMINSLGREVERKIHRTWPSRQPDA
jgi:chromosome partitioning protein